MISTSAYHGLRRQHRAITGKEAVSIASASQQVEVVGVLYEGHREERVINRYVLRAGFTTQILLGNVDLEKAA